MDTRNESSVPDNRASLPLVRLALIQPFIAELDRLGIETDALLTTNGLARVTVGDPNVFVPAIIVYRFVEDAARAAKNPYLGLEVGERLDLASWPPFVDAVTHARTLGEFLIRFIRSARDEASSARQVLEVGASHTYFREVRATVPGIEPAQNDAFMAAFTLGLLSRGAAELWAPEQVRVTVCEPRALPAGYLGVSIIGGDVMGIAIHFPTEWLFGPVDQRALCDVACDERGRLGVPIGFIDGVRQILMLNLQDRDLGLDQVARLSGMSQQSLQRKLKASGTTFSAEIRKAKKRHAEELLSNTNLRVTEIAQSVGFSDPTSFTRAFHSWTGKSPRVYRKKRPIRPGDPGASMT